MTLSPESPSPATPPGSTTVETIGRVTRPSRIPPLKIDLRVELSRVPAALTAIGTALVSAAVVIATIHARVRHHLDGSNYTMGLLATAGLLAVAIVAGVLVPDAERRASLVSWPGAAGIIALGAMAGVGIHTHPQSIYVTSLVILAFSGCAYAAVRAPAFTLSAIAGAALLYGQGFRDAFHPGGILAELNVDGGGKDHNTFMIIGAGVVGFVVLATALCWVLPSAVRDLDGIVIGGVAIAALYYLSTFLMLNRYQFDYNPHSSALVNDIWVVLGYSVALALFWLGCFLVSGHVGFRILAVIATAYAVPVAAYELVVSHPTWWEVVACGIGGFLLLAVCFILWNLHPAPTEPDAEVDLAS